MDLAAGWSACHSFQTDPPPDEKEGEGGRGAGAASDTMAAMKGEV